MFYWFYDDITIMSIVEKNAYCSNTDGEITREFRYGDGTVIHIAS